MKSFSAFLLLPMLGACAPLQWANDRGEAVPQLQAPSEIDYVDVGTSQRASEWTADWPQGR